MQNPPFWGYTPYPVGTSSKKTPLNSAGWVGILGKMLMFMMSAYGYAKPFRLGARAGLPGGHSLVCHSAGVRLGDPFQSDSLDGQPGSSGNLVRLADSYGGRCGFRFGVSGR